MFLFFRSVAVTAGPFLLSKAFCRRERLIQKWDEAQNIESNPYRVLYDPRSNPRSVHKKFSTMSGYRSVPLKALPPFKNYSSSWHDPSKFL